MTFLSPAGFFKINFLKNLSGTLSDCQRVQLDQDQDRHSVVQVIIRQQKENASSKESVKLRNVHYELEI